MTVNFIFDTATLNSHLSSERLKQEIDISSGNEGSKNENKIGTFFSNRLNHALQKSFNNNRSTEVH